MTNQTISPALTEKEWDTCAMWRGLHMVAGTNTGFDVRLNAGGGNPARAYGEFPIDDLPGIMALANHALPDGHPLKITRDDVSNVLAFANYLREYSSFGIADMFQQDDYRTLAAKLAALLPPKD